MHAPLKLLASLAALTLVATLFLRPGRLAAQTSGVWANAGGGSWNSSSNWQNGAIASGSGAAADFTQVTLQQNIYVTLSSPITVGSMMFNSQGGWNYQVNGTTLTLATSSGTPDISNFNGREAEIAVPIAGNQGVTIDAAAGATGLVDFWDSNTYSGPTTILAGTLFAVAAANALPPTTALTIDSGAALSFVTYPTGAQTVASLSGAGSVFAQQPTVPVIFTVGTDNTDSTFSGTMRDDDVITGSGPSDGTLTLVKAGTGALTLSGASTYVGGTTIAAGAIVMGNSSTSSGSTISNGPLGAFHPGAATMDNPVNLGDAASGSTAPASLLFGTTAGLTLANPIVAQDNTSGTLTLGGQNTSGVNTFTSNITLGATANTGKSITLSAAAGGQVSFTGNILANGSDTSAGITVSGPGTVLLSGANTFAGGTTVASGGRLIANSSGALGDPTGNTVVQAGGSLTAYQIVQNSLTIHGTGTTAATAGSVTLVPSGSGSTGNPNGPNNINFSSALTSLSIDNNGAPLGSRVYYGTLDISNNGLVIAYGGGTDPYANIDDMIRSGFDDAHWDGTGITSSLGAAAAESHTPLNIGLLDFTPGAGNYSNTTFMVFAGQTIATNAILVRLTYMDDINLFGDMSVQNAASDALIFAANYGSGTTWSVGDLDHNAVIGSNDALLFAANYVTGLPTLDGTTGNAVAIGGSAAAVPEPTSAILSGLGACLLCIIARRRI